jgi:hypothetical protein
MRLGVALASTPAQASPPQTISAEQTAGPDLSSEESLPDEEEARIVRVKRFSVKPMYPEDAIEEMELLGHTFYVFWNADDDRINVVYRRKDGNYGLIQPEPD